MTVPDVDELLVAVIELLDNITPYRRALEREHGDTDLRDIYARLARATGQPERWLDPDNGPGCTLEGS
ncbi:MAG TPA: hypothetical protein VLL25_14820 [Acidimicrobiales bacterium]|nr:hypothetical protein [Acidimicrobiales bacterium]